VKRIGDDAGHLRAEKRTKTVLVDKSEVIEVCAVT
jgi:hypothetical protein